MKKILACFILCTIVLTSCNPIVVKITIGSVQASQPTPAKPVSPIAAAQTPTLTTKMQASGTILADAAATPTVESAPAASNPVTGAQPTATPLADSPAEGSQNGPCASSSPSSSAYTVKICFTSPTGGSALSGDVTMSAVVSVSGGPGGVQRVIFYLDSKYVLTDYQSPYTFSLPTSRWEDGSHTLSVEALLRDGFTTNKASLPVTFKNGITQLAVTGNKFSPTSGTIPPAGAPFVVVAAGDGASGEANESKVVNLISSLNPNLFLYLGDVYEKGGLAEFNNWYGVNGSLYSRFRPITDPTVGNHEYLSSTNAEGYFSYWNDIPNYYSFNAGGWHFISLNSNYNKIGVGADSEQYTWLKQDLEANKGTCTIVYYHHPLYNIGPEGPTTAMAAIWALLADYKVPIVLNGHDHDYQRWNPLDGSGKPSQTGITEFVAGGGGHGVQKITKSDDRVAFWSSKSPESLGALQLTLTPSAASFSYLNIMGATLDSGTVACNK